MEYHRRADVDRGHAASPHRRVWSCIEANERDGRDVDVTRAHLWLIPVAASLSVVSGCDHGITDSGKTPQSLALQVDGRGNVADRFTAEVWVVGNVAYTSTWGARTVNDVRSVGNAIKIWNVDGTTPVLVDSSALRYAAHLPEITSGGAVFRLRM